MERAVDAGGDTASRHDASRIHDPFIRSYVGGGGKLAQMTQHPRRPVTARIGRSSSATSDTKICPTGQFRRSGEDLERASEIEDFPLRRTTRWRQIASVPPFLDSSSILVGHVART